MAEDGNAGHEQDEKDYRARKLHLGCIGASGRGREPADLSPANTRTTSGVPAAAARPGGSNVTVRRDVPYARC
jgi:hypothetical protein